VKHFGPAPGAYIQVSNLRAIMALLLEDIVVLVQIIDIEKSEKNQQDVFY
jgi:hypothetical protein